MDDVDDAADAPESVQRQRRQLRLVGYGMVVSGLLAVAVATASTRPHDILVYGLAALAVGTVVVEKTQDGAMGLSLGFLTGSFGVYLWPQLGGGSYLALGAMLCVAGLFNAAMTPYLHGLGERLAGR